MAAAIFWLALPRISVFGRDMVPPGDEFDSSLNGAYIPYANFGFCDACNATKMDENGQSLRQAQASRRHLPVEFRNGNIINDHCSMPSSRLDVVEHHPLLDTG